MKNTDINIKEKDTLLGLKEASDFLGCHPNSLRNWEKKGLIKSVRFGVRGDRKFYLSDLNELMKDGFNKDETLSLPSEYDLSRIDMTGSKYTDIDTRVRENRDLLDKEIISRFDFLKFKQEFTSKIRFFEEKDFLKTKTTAEKILKIILSQRYRSGSLYVLNLEKHRENILSRIQYFIDNNEPIQFMLPALPFKIRNPLKSSRGDADLAEVGSFLRFNEIHLQIQKVYKHGVKFIIFHDGHLYYESFFHSKKDADIYYKTLQTFIEKLDLKEVIDIRDAKEEIKKIDDYQNIYQQARKEISNLWNKSRYNNEKIRSIIRSAQANINLSHIPYETLYRINFSEEWDLTREEKEIKEKINRDAETCAFEYMVVQHALEKMNFFTTLVPHGVRLTVHPKDGQIGIYLVKAKTYLLPWMGVGVLKNNGQITVRYESDVKSNKRYHPVFIKGEKYPFYYKEAEIVYEGVDGLKRLFDNILHTLNKGDSYLSFSFNDEYSEPEVKELLVDVHKRLKEKRIKDRSICRENLYDDLVETYRDVADIKFKPVKVDIPSGVIILDNRVINLIWGEIPVAYEITDTGIIKHYKKYFEELWKS